jgi:N-acetylmuramoyl-L-alanine amidase
MGFKVFINPGHALHGIPDPGAVGPTGLRESDVVMDVGLLLAERLKQEGIDTFLLQLDNLGDVCDCSNSWQPDCFVSIHCNAFVNPAAKGMEIFTSYGHTRADSLADAIMRELEGEFPALNVRGDWTDGDIDKEGGLYVLNRTDAPAVLVELAFISNEHEEALLRTPEAQRRYAAALARGIINWLNTR